MKTTNSTTKTLFAALVSMMLLTTACGKSSNGAEESTTPTTDTSNCTNCNGFVAGPTVFSGNLSSGAFRIDGLTVVADKNSLSSVTGTSPQTSGTYQGMATAGTFVASGSSCIADGSYTISGLQVGVISQSYTPQTVSPLWVTLTGPSKIRAPMYIKLKDNNGDDVGDSGTLVYLWFQCNGAWTSVGLSAN